MLKDSLHLKRKRFVRESTIETEGTRLLAEAGFTVYKLGTQGWPDREVGWKGLRVYIEWKTPTGRLTLAQRVRVPRLRAKGEQVLVLTDAKQAVPEVRKAMALVAMSWRPPP